MRLKKEDVFPINQDQIRDIFTALDMSYKDLEGICGLSEFAPSRWRKSGQIPMTHLLRLAEEFNKKFKGKRKEDLTPLEQRASKYLSNVFITAYALLKGAEGTAKPTSVFAIQLPTDESSHVEPYASSKLSSENPLAKYSELELMRELESRGMKVNISLRGNGE